MSDGGRGRARRAGGHSPVETDAEIAALYAVAPERFIAARDALVKRLRTAGDRAGADRVRTLRRPSPALWAVNGLARREPGAIAALLQAAEGLRSAQGRLLAGETGDDLNRSAQAHRDAVHELADLGRGLLEESGRPASVIMVERIRRTLHSASLLEEARPLLAEGRLTGEVPAQGFGIEGVGAAPGEPRRRRVDPALEAARRDRERRAEVRDAAERALEAAERARDAAMERLRATRTELERMEAGAAAAERALEVARRATTDAERALQRALDGERRADDELRAGVERAHSVRADEQRAREVLERTQAEVEEARASLRATDAPGH